jgi:hypothetical protein
MNKFFVDMFSSSEGASHKRVLGAIGFISLIAYMFIHKDIKAIEAVEYISIAYGIGTVAEKFKPNAKEQNSIEE